MRRPLVSVIIPCFNNAQHIKTAVDSVLTQDYPNLEVIVVNDGSTDNSIEVLSQFANKIKLITQINQGPAVARNTGILAARGDYIAFNDGDDIWLPGKVQAQVSYLEKNPDTGLCYTSWKVWDQKVALADFAANIPTPSDTQKIIPEKSGWLYTNLLNDSVVCTITAMIRADVVKTVGLFNEKYLIGEDHDYWIRISQLCKIDKLTGIYAIYRVNLNSTTKKVHNQNYSLLVLTAALEKYGRSCPSGKIISQSQATTYLGERHFTYGYNALIKGHRHKALESFQGCIRCKYRLLKAFFFWCICAIPPLYKLFLQRKNAQVVAEH
jgi:glycosyltransferase involved in cell wall biosynthesis